MALNSVWVGIDMGVEQSVLCAIDANGGKLLDQTVSTDADAMRLLLSQLADHVIEKVAVEAGSTGLHAIRGLIACGLPVAIYEAQRLSKYLRIRSNKTDRNDAAGLADVARLSFPGFHDVHLKSPQTQNMRTYLGIRHKVVVQRVAFEGILRSLFRLYGGSVKTSYRAVRFEEETLAELTRLKDTCSLDLSPQVGPLLDVCLKLRSYQADLTNQIEHWVANNPVCSRFVDIPGVGPICALSFYSAIEEPFRFARTSDVAAYLGLTPKVLQSGKSLKHGRISRHGSRLTRTHLVQSAGILLRSQHQSDLRDWGLAIRQRAGWGKACVAVSRKLATVMLAMWKSGARFEPQPMKRTADPAVILTDATRGP